ncbi:MAG: reprolysin-like metallopeptidase [Aquabacterium sp.]|jgi:hypothetical protein
MSSRWHPWTPWKTGVLLVACLGAAPALMAASQPLPEIPEVRIRDGGVQLDIHQPMRLDATRLMSMSSGERITLNLPVLGRRVVVFESLTTGADGLPYWHGHFQGAPRDRIYLKQHAQGFTGAVRLGSRERRVLSLRQDGPHGVLQEDAHPRPVAGQMHVLGRVLAPGVQEISLNTAAVMEAEVGSELAVPLPGGQTEVIVVTATHLDADGFKQLEGVSRLDGRGHPTVLTVGTHAVFGVVHNAQGEYQIVTQKGRTRILDPQQAGWTAPRGSDQMHIEDRLAQDGWREADEPTVAAQRVETAPPAAAPRAAASGTASSAGSGLSPLPAGREDTRIRVLMTYSPTFVQLWGNEQAARARISNLVATANAAYLNSGTGVRFEVVGWRQLNQADNTPQTQLEAMRLARGAFSALPALRRDSGAAISVFVAPFNAITSRTSTCGVAYVPGARLGGLAAYRAQAPGQLFTVINDGQHGRGYCEALTLAHEWGHNLGAVHDRAHSSFAGVFAASYGRGVPGQFGTVMSYISPRVGLFSSPGLTCTASGARCGTAQEDVVSTVLQTKAIAAAQGGQPPAPPPPPVQVAGWLLNSNGSPYRGAVTLNTSRSDVRCTAGNTGLYLCVAPQGVGSLTITPTISRRAVSPSRGSVVVPVGSAPVVQGPHFYVR